MTSKTNTLYLRYIADLYKGRGMRVVLVYDHAPTHVSDQVKHALKDISGSRLEQEDLVVEFIDPCLTSIYLPPDIVVNGPLKKMKESLDCVFFQSMWSGSMVRHYTSAI
jgi:hypothetical protein